MQSNPTNLDAPLSARNNCVICAQFSQGSCASPTCPYTHFDCNVTLPIPALVCPAAERGMCVEEGCMRFHGKVSLFRLLAESDATAYSPLTVLPICDPIVAAHDLFPDVAIQRSVSRNNSVLCARYCAGRCPLTECPFAHADGNVLRSIPSQLCPNAEQDCSSENCMKFHGKASYFRILRESDASMYRPLTVMFLRDPLDTQEHDQGHC